MFVVVLLVGELMTEKKTTDLLKFRKSLTPTVEFFYEIVVVVLVVLMFL